MNRISIASLVVAVMLTAAAGVRSTAAAADADDTVRGAAESTKDAAHSAGSAVKHSAEGAAGAITDSAHDTTARMTGKDALFVRKAAIGGIAEVKSAELAKDKASSAEVKSFAEQMIKDHEKANRELEDLAERNKISVPTALDHEHQKRIDELAKLSGNAFDRAYVKQQKEGHHRMLKLMDDEAANGTDADLKDFAAKTKGVVTEHLQRVEDLSHDVLGHSMKTSAR
jgi:putative membrane protein